MENSNSTCATLINTSGASSSITLEADLQDRLSQMQRMVGGFIQVVPLSEQLAMVIHEDEKLYPHVENTVATALARKQQAIIDSDYIAGNALIVSLDAVC